MAMLKKAVAGSSVQKREVSAQVRIVGWSRKLPRQQVLASLATGPEASEVTQSERAQLHLHLAARPYLG